MSKAIVENPLSNHNGVRGTRLTLLPQTMINGMKIYKTVVFRHRSTSDALQETLQEGRQLRQVLCATAHGPASFQVAAHKGRHKAEPARSLR